MTPPTGSASSSGATTSPRTSTAAGDAGSAVTARSRSHDIGMRVPTCPLRYEMRSLLLLVPALAAPAFADTKVATSTTPARQVPQVCPVAADVTRPWTHDVFPGCAPY